MEDGVALGVRCVIIEHGGEDDVERHADNEQDLVVWVFEGVELGEQGDGDPVFTAVDHTPLDVRATYAADPRASLTLLVVWSSTYPEPMTTCGNHHHT